MAAPRGEVTTPMRRGKAGIGLLAAGLEQAFGGQLGLQLLEGNLQRARALGFEVLGLELQVAALVVDGDPAASDDLQAVLRPKAQQPRLRPPHHHPQLRRAILQREVKMSGLGRPVVGDFAFDVNVGEGALHLGAHRGHQFAHRIDLARRRLKGQPELFACRPWESVWRQCIARGDAVRCSLFSLSLFAIRYLPLANLLGTPVSSDGLPRTDTWIGKRRSIHNLEGLAKSEERTAKSGLTAASDSRHTSTSDRITLSRMEVTRGK